MNTAWTWELSGHCTKYSFLTETKGLTMREAERIFQLDPEPPVHENLNEYIIEAVQSHELCWFSFFLHCYEILDLKYVYDNQEQHVFPTVLFGKNDVVLVDCGYPGSLAMIEEQLCAHSIEPAVVTKLLLTHQDDHMGAAAELKKKYPDIQILVSYKEAPYISGKLKNLRLQQGEDLQKQLPDDQKAFGEQFCERYRSLTPVPVDILLYDGDQFDWGGGCEIMATPGHMPGHISIRSLDDGYLVTGDAAVVSGNELIIANPEFCLDRDAAQCSLEKILQIPCRRYLCYHSGVFEA